MADNQALLTIEELVSSVEGSVLVNGASTVGVFGVAADSRAVRAGYLFVPLIGEFQDGHSYIPAAIDAGATCVFVDREHARLHEDSYRPAAEGKAWVIAVEDTLRALQDAAKFYVSKFPRLLKIGVTGSSGKTTTKEILASIFRERYRVVMNEGNLNSETGLPLSVFRIREEHEVGIFELGMNRRGEIGEIAGVLSPRLALITNIGTAHIGILGTKAAIAEEKKSIFSEFTEGCTGFVPERDEWTSYLSDIRKGEVFTYGRFSTPGYDGAEDRGIDGTAIYYGGERISFPLPGAYNLANAIGAIALASHAGLSVSEIKRGLEGVKPLFGRAQILRGKRTAIVDCYNANPDSMEKAIDFCSSLTWKGKKIFVIGSMLELGEESRAEHDKICAQLSASDADRVFLFGEDMIAAGSGIDWDGMDCRSFDTIESLSEALAEGTEDGDLVFLKGSRGMALERVLPAALPGYSGEAYHA